MNKNGPILIVEDDIDDQYMFAKVFVQLEYKNEIIFFSEGEKILEYLNNNKVEPFLIFSDIAMPKLNGMELREKLQESDDLRIRSIPYLFFTTGAPKKDITDAYSKSIQGFFIKPMTFSALEEKLKVIIDYWQNSV